MKDADGKSDKENDDLLEAEEYLQNIMARLREREKLLQELEYRISTLESELLEFAVEKVVRKGDVSMLKMYNQRRKSIELILQTEVKKKEQLLYDLQSARERLKMAQADLSELKGDVR